LGYREGEFPVSEQIANECLSLPIYPELRLEQVGSVANALEHSLG
jgi:dTDP-4-amino-4,6-dideoxygalactose transaminase